MSSLPDTGGSVVFMITGKMLIQVSQLKCIKMRNKIKTEAVQGAGGIVTPTPFKLLEHFIWSECFKKSGEELCSFYSFVLTI